MTESKRTKGRPKDTGIDDSQPLGRMADLLLAHPGMKPKTAAAHVAPQHLGANSLDSVVHRLARKWRKESGVWMAQARKRQEDSRPVVRYAGSGGGYTPGLPSVGYGYAPGYSQSASGYLAGQAESMMAIARERDRLLGTYARPVDELQRALDLLQRQSIATASQRLQDSMERSLRQADELRRIEMLSRGPWPYRGY